MDGCCKNYFCENPRECCKRKKSCTGIKSNPPPCSGNPCCGPQCCGPQCCGPQCCTQQVIYVPEYPCMDCNTTQRVSYLRHDCCRSREPCAPKRGKPFNGCIDGRTIQRLSYQPHCYIPRTKSIQPVDQLELFQCPCDNDCCMPCPNPCSCSCSCQCPCPPPQDCQCCRPCSTGENCCTKKRWVSKCKRRKAQYCC